MEGIIDNRPINNYEYEKNLHYDLDFLNEGNSWPPKEDANRLHHYANQRRQFELEPVDQLQTLLPEGLLSLVDYETFTKSCKLLGYPRLMTLKLVDMIIGQPPIISAQGDDEKTEKIKDVRCNCQFNSTFEQALIDYSRHGVLLYRVFKDEQSKPMTAAWDPSEWFPVFFADGTKRIHYNVLGWSNGKEVTVQIHNAQNGEYEERVIELTSSNTLGRTKSAKMYNTGSGKKLFFAVVNTPTSTNPFGTNDYAIINGLLQKAIQRLQAILRVLDEHADPSMTGPHSLLKREENGEMVFYTSKYYAVGKDEERPQYLTWDGQLESSFKAFDVLCKQIYVLSEMGEAFLGTADGGGNVVSGTAMRFKMLSPLEKARRVENRLTEPVKDIMSTLMFLAGEEIVSSDINIAWRDSLPKDPSETANLTRLESGAPAVKPLFHALMDNYELDKETAQHYVENILVEQEKFRLSKNDPVNPQDGRSKTPEKVDVREKNSMMDPASSENHSEDPDGET